jgi:hypothetical protein
MTAPDASAPSPPPVIATTSRSYLVGTVYAGAVAVIALGVFLPWATLSAPFIGTLSKAGFEGDGIFALVFALVYVVLATLDFVGQEVHSAIHATVGGLLIMFAGYEILNIVATNNKLDVVGTTDSFGLAQAMADATSITPGIGLVLTMLAGFATTGVAIWTNVRTGP